MNEDTGKVLLEIRDMMKLLMEEQRQLIEDMRELKVEQKKMHDEMRISNFVLNNINLRNEILN